ncbi:hypothetical protein BDR22DRAFT_863041, partial [Usnea florida]
MCGGESPHPSSFSSSSLPEECQKGIALNHHIHPTPPIIQSPNPSPENFTSQHRDRHTYTPRPQHRPALPYLQNLQDKPITFVS